MGIWMLLNVSPQRKSILLHVPLGTVTLNEEYENKIKIN